MRRVPHNKSCTIKLGDSDCGVIMCFGTKFKVSVDLTVIESEFWDIPYVTVINDLWNSI